MGTEKTFLAAFTFSWLPRGASIVMAMSLRNICFGLIDSGLIVKGTPATGIITQYENYGRSVLNMVSQSMAIHFAARFPRDTVRAEKILTRKENNNF